MMKAVVIAAFVAVLFYGDGYAQTASDIDALRAEVRALRDEVARLRSQIDAMMQPSASQRPASAEEFEAFCGKFVPLLEAEFRRDAKGATYKLKTSSIDLKKSDSVSSPIVGELVFSYLWSVTDESKGYSAYKKMIFTLQFAPRQTGWELVSGKAVVETDSSVPQVNPSTVGQVTTLARDWQKGVIAAANSAAKK